MNVRNCRGCGRIFNYVTGPFLCIKCREEMEVKFQEVKEYIRQHPAGWILMDGSVVCLNLPQASRWNKTAGTISISGD